MNHNEPTNLRVVLETFHKMYVSETTRIKKEIDDSITEEQRQRLSKELLEWMGG